MSMLSLTYSKRSAIFFPDPRGVSDSANALQGQSEELQRHFAQSITFGEHLCEMLENLLKAKEEYSVDNWDGYGAKAIDEFSYEKAVRFALSLPSIIPTPEIHVDPDGEVRFEWYEGPRRVFSVSIANNYELSYAGLFGANKTYGIEQFHDDIPDAILDNIERVFSKGIYLGTTQRG